MSNQGHPGPRIVVYGNSGAGKTTLARRLAEAGALPILSLDAIAFEEGAVRKPLAESVRSLEEFATAHDAWVIEGCYGDLVEAALPFATELRFLDPGVERCIAHCRARPWEPDKYPTRADQDAMLENLIAWVETYESRDDEFGAARHRAIFERFVGEKVRVTDSAAPL